MEKEVRKISAQQFRRLLSLVYQGTEEKSELAKIIDDEAEKLSEFIKDKAQWSQYYELPYSHFVAFFYIALGLREKIAEINSSKDPIESVIAWGETEPESPLNLEELSDEEKMVVFGLMVAMIRNFTSIQIFHVPINELIQKAKEEDDALFDAIFVDRHVMNTPTAAARIARAEIIDDGHFFDLLTKAITKTRPRRPKKDFDILRMMLSILDEAIGISNLSYEEVHKLIVDDLQLYPDDLKDSFSGLKKLLQRRKKHIGT